MIEEFESEMEVEEDRNRRRREKEMKRFTNAKVRPQDEVDWDESKQDAEPCPLCVHYFKMAIETRAEVTADNEAVRAAYSEVVR